MEYELLKAVTEWRKIVENMEHDSKKKIAEVQREKQLEINTIEQNCTKIIAKNKQETNAQILQANENSSEKIKLVEIQMEAKLKELNQDWSLKLKSQQEKADEILKECQSISEYSIIQCELEKNELATRLKQEKEELVSENILLQEIISKLKTDVSNTIKDLTETREKLKTEENLHKTTIEQSKIREHSYEITLNKTHETINMLKNRLLHSDCDVEQLKLEIENVENNSVGQEGKICDLEHQIEKLKIEKQTLEVENAALKFEIEHKIKILEGSLLEKVDDLRVFADEKVEKLSQVRIIIIINFYLVYTGCPRYADLLNG